MPVHFMIVCIQHIILALNLSIFHLFMCILNCIHSLSEIFVSSILVGEHHYC